MNMQLDDLVLQNVVAMERNCLENIIREQVSKRLAIILRSHYDATQFGVIIRSPSVDHSENDCYLIELGTFGSPYGILEKLCEWTVNRRRLKSALALIFSRIKRFRILKIRSKFCPSICKDITTALLLENGCNWQFLQLNRLDLMDGDMSKNNKCSISMFSPEPCEQCGRKHGKCIAVLEEQNLDGTSQ
jgi:hypothetical protein